jgi:hypothetical protein
MLAAQYAAQAIFYLSSTSFTLNRVINGRGLGGPVAELDHLTQEELDRMGQGDVFLNNATGDLYAYN